MQSGKCNSSGKSTETKNSGLTIIKNHIYFKVFLIKNSTQFFFMHLIQNCFENTRRLIKMSLMKS